ncbi:MAG: glycoside hydrolase family 97 catalytic domain-containing protein [Prolixibacteraceae bacterium]
MNANRIYMVFLVLLATTVSAKEVTLESPDKNLQVKIRVEENVSLDVYSNDNRFFSVSNIYLETDKGNFPGKTPHIKQIKNQSADRQVIPAIKEKTAVIDEKYNETTIRFKAPCKLVVRAYNDGFAYRFSTEIPGEITIKNEHADFIADPSSLLIFQEDDDKNSDYEAPYIHKTVAGLKSGDKGNLPAFMQVPSGERLVFLEADVVDYPVLWINKNQHNLESFFWNYPAAYHGKGDSKSIKQVTELTGYMAKTKGTRDFPWRIFAVANQDIDLIKNQLVYLMGPELKIDDPSWVKPGWVLLDWWARREIFGVDFKAGINTPTAKYMIDFCSEYGIRYFLLDDGWTKNEDLTKVVPGLNMEEVIGYARSKNVDVMLWVTYSNFDDQMEAALQQFSRWGVKGVKIDFMNRSDQEMVNFYWRAAEQCAKYHMVIDFHGAYKPDGLRRAYPNVLTREALIEFEYSGGTDFDNPDHHCMLPFIRNVAGPMDYIPGTMRNSTKASFRINGNMPMGQGTRAHSIAMAVIAESPMQMLPDAPSEYYREQECTGFLTGIPVVWDEVIPLFGKVGDYVAVARRHRNEWYVAAITDWNARELALDFHFLDEGKSYTIELIRDGINADIRGNDYKKETHSVKKGDQLQAWLAPGGGWVARIY